MIGTLIVSEARVQQRGLGSAVSIVVHATLIIGAVVITSTSSTGPVKSVVYFPVPQYVPPLPARGSPVPARPAQTSALAVPRMPAIRVPTVMPSEIPPVDLTSVPALLDFGERRSPADASCTTPCPQPAVRGDAGSSPLMMNSVVMQLREPAVAPRYPEALRRAGVSGTVVVKFIVDTLGRVDSESIEVLSSSHDLFTAAVRDVLFGLRFNPATFGNHRVRAAAVMPFQFMLKRP